MALALTTLLSVAGSAGRVAEQPGAAVGEAAVSSYAQDMRELERAAPGSCRPAREGLRFYRGRASRWAATRGAARPVTRTTRAPRNCADARYLARLWKQRAAEQRRTTEKWQRWRWYHYAWRDWLPANWVALARCETSLNFEHSNSSFTSAFGISWAVYNSNARYMGAPPWHVRHTPRDQYKAALGHLARFGDGWTCPGP